MEGFYLINQQYKFYFFLLNILSSIFLINAEYTQHRQESLDPNGNFNVEWWIDFENELVKFDLTVNTIGWIGFGLSPSGGMENADIIVGGVDENGDPYFSDRHGIGEMEPEVDVEENWALNGAVEYENVTKISILRKFDTCDTEDVPITYGTTNFIWAYSSSGSDDLSYHLVNRGTFAVQILDPTTPPVDLTKYQSYKINHTMTMPSKDTTYWCTIHKSPLFTTKNHIVAFEPILDSPEALAHTHHYNIFRCKAPAGGIPEEFFEPFVGGVGGECYVPNPAVPTAHCQTMFYNWAVGGHMLVLPENIGYPIGETGNQIDYYMFEIHYNNPQELSGVTFETGATIYYTDEPREHNAGLMVVAHHTSISLTVPPNSLDYKIVGHCHPECTQNYLPHDGINVFAIFLHAHLSGRKMKFRQFRGAEELPWPANDETYNFEFQQTRLLREELKVLPGDQLSMECIYNTDWTTGSTIGGLSTREEMCQSIFWYYPRAELRDCRSEYPIEELFKKFGIENATRETPYDNAIITAPPKYAGKRYTEVLNDMIDWTDELRNELQIDSLNSPHVGVCWTDTETREIQSTTYPANLQSYQPIDSCGDNQFSLATTLEKNVYSLLVLGGFIIVMVNQ